MKSVNVAVIGVGAVGVEMLQILKQRNFPINRLRVFARHGRQIAVNDCSYNVEAIEGQEFDGIDIALFAGTEGEKGASSLYAQKFIEKGAIVIDNGADFRLKEGVPLVVPEVNEAKIYEHKGLIANPNCTTIQAVVALGGIYKQFGLEKFILTSFQATSGAGKRAAQGLWEETKSVVETNQNVEYDHLKKRIEIALESGFSHQIAFNIIPQIGSIGEEGYTTEEWKVIRETHKIMDNHSIRITATCARVPVFTSHSEAIYFKPHKKTAFSELEEVLQHTKGVKYFPHALPLPLDSEGTDEVFVGRLRRDPHEENSFWLWCVADNLRKGAALNAVQIAEHLLAKQ
ncbi:MAG: aspartate-semialdehyde dehydrogenase [Candidatus Omnitrophota bacterium]|nr:MAG: aspartate-semialdehyde dehydrogenase [Candidatus Omnitrophota bacterium]